MDEDREPSKVASRRLPSDDRRRLRFLLATRMERRVYRSRSSGGLADNRLSVGADEGDVDAEPHRVGDIGELAEREVAPTRFDRGYVGGRGAQTFGDLGLGEAECVAGRSDLAADDLRVDFRSRGARHRL
jgi:hypothetical protein